MMPWGRVTCGAARWVAGWRFASGGVWAATPERARPVHPTSRMRAFNGYGTEWFGVVPNGSKRGRFLPRLRRFGRLTVTGRNVAI